MSENLHYPTEALVYGATVIHHSERLLLQNYYNPTHNDDEKTRRCGLLLAGPSNKDFHYSIFEDKYGTCILDIDGLDIMPKLTELIDHDFTCQGLDGIYCPGHDLVEIVKCFIKAKELIETDEFTQDQAFLLDEEIRKLHPRGHIFGTGFHEFDPEEMK